MYGWLFIQVEVKQEENQAEDDEYGYEDDFEVMFVPICCIFSKRELEYHVTLETYAIVIIRKKSLWHLI